MFEKIQPMPEDKILGLMKLYRADERDTKVDLGVGVYKDASGLTPIMRAVKAAEKKLWDAETTKSYTGLAGEADYHAVMRDLVLGDSVDHERVACLHTPGGTGAIRQVLELVKMTSSNATIWYSNPTWPNHISLVDHVGLASKAYTYIDSETLGVDFEGMMADLEGVAKGDVVILHGCCHNPTGANLNTMQWNTVADLLENKGAVPFIDIAYQGFGDGLDEDGAATRMIAARFDEVLIAASCSKNFGIYRERAGIVLAIAKNDERQALLQGALSFLNRQNYSFPPDHGARLVTMILQDEDLKADWKAELEEVRLSMLQLRQSLADALQAETGSNRFGFIAEHRGMFSRLGLSPEQVVRLREEHAIYMVGDSRINVAGLNGKTVPVLAKAIATVL